MGKTRDLLKKIRDTKGTFHAKLVTIKNRNDMDLAEAKDMRKNCTKKVLMTQTQWCGHSPRARHPGV